jgi:hypothetical protein
MGIILESSAAVGPERHRLRLPLGYVLAPLFLASCGVALLSVSARAEARWCSITAIRSTDTLLYPPIAKAARISGIVLGRVTFRKTGTVDAVQVISGPVILARGLTEQLKTWSVTTDANGTEPCESLIVAKFTLIDPDAAVREAEPQPVTPSIYQVAVQDQPIVLSDPAAYIGKRRWSRFWRHQQ